MQRVQSVARMREKSINLYDPDPSPVSRDCEYPLTDSNELGQEISNLVLNFNSKFKEKSHHYILSRMSTDYYLCCLTSQSIRHVIKLSYVYQNLLKVFIHSSKIRIIATVHGTQNCYQSD